MSYHFAFSYCSWGSQGKNTEMVCHCLLQRTTFCQNSLPWPICLGWPYMAWLIFMSRKGPKSLLIHSWVGHLLDMWFSSMSLSVKLVSLSAQAAITEYTVRTRVKDGMLQLAHPEDLAQHTQRKQNSLKGAWSPSSPSPCCFSVTKSCVTLCDPMDCSTPSSSVFHYLSEFAQIHVRWVGDAI